MIRPVPATPPGRPIAPARPILRALLAGLALAGLLAAPGAVAGQQAAEREATLPPAEGNALPPDSLAAFLPGTVAGWERTELRTRTLPPGPVAEAVYEREGRTLSVALLDLGGQAEADLAAYLESLRRQAEEGEARPVTFGEVPGYVGTGVSDDVVVPHGAMALAGRRFQVMAFEMAEGLSSVADVKALPEDTLAAMIDRARELVAGIDLQRLAARGEPSGSDPQGKAMVDSFTVAP